MYRWLTRAKSSCRLVLRTTSLHNKTSNVYSKAACRPAQSVSKFDGVRSFASIAPVWLSTISDPSLKKKKRRVGRGVGSGRGKTSGRGHKGQKSRNGRRVKLGFEGGQTPIKQYTPKRGFTNIFKSKYAIIHLATIENAIQRGRLPADKVLTMKDFRDSGILRNTKILDGMKIIGRSHLPIKVNVEVTAASNVTKEAIKKNGGSIKIVYYNKLCLRALLYPEWFAKKERNLPGFARPPPSKQGKFEAIGTYPPLGEPTRVYSLFGPLENFMPKHKAEAIEKEFAEKFAPQSYR